MTKHKKSTYNLDWVLVAVVVALLLYGLLMLYSVTLSTYIRNDFFTRQLRWLGVGLLTAWVMYKIPYPVWQKIAVMLMGITLLLLLLTIVASRPAIGSAYRGGGLSEDPRHLGTMVGLGNSIQPGVLARLVSVIYIATWLASKGDQLSKVSYGLVPFGVIVGLVGGLVALQPDLSTALLIVITAVAMFFFAGGDPIQIFVALIVVGVTFGLLVSNLGYARQRLEDYVVALSDPARMPYQVQKAIQAITEGGITGVGIGAGRMKFGYLPIPHTDSIFAVIAEEVGLLGCLVVIGLFITFAARGYRVTLGTPDAFGAVLAFGLTTMILTEALLNVMVMLALFPPTGTALPFFSYGGSAMVITLSGVGLLLGVSRGRPKGDWDAILDRWWRDGRARLSGARRRSGFARHRS